MMNSLRAKLALGVCAGLMTLSTVASAGEFKLTSPSVAPDSRIGDKYVFSGFGCHGGNQSPALRWSGAPDKTQSFALTVYDPDAPTGSGWWHWVVYDIPNRVTGLAEGAGLPNGIGLPGTSQQGRTDFGMPGYGGPCPPVGDKPHRYVFTLYALKVPKLDVAADATAAMVGFMINANKIGESSFTATFGR